MRRIEELIRSMAPLYLLVARVLFGAFMITHGYPKLMDMSGFITKVGQMGFPLPEVMGPLAIAAELVGGFLVLIGYKTRLACVFILITMLNAAFVVHALDPFKKKEFALVYALLALVFMASGPGKISVDKS